MKAIWNLAISLVFFNILVGTAATYTWTGDSTTTNNWSDAANWQSGVPMSDPATEIVFASAGAQSASTPNSFQNLSPDPFQLASLTFSLPGSDSFSLDGGALSASTADGSILTITQNSAGMVTVGNNLSASFAIRIGGDGTGLLVLNGTVNAESGGLTKSGTSTVQFNGNSNLYSLSVEGGTVIQTAQQTIHRTLAVSAGATYNLTSGLLSTGNGESISGTFNQTGGMNQGPGVNLSGIYNLSAGMLHGDMSVSATGSFQQSGGTAGVAFLNIAGGGSVTTSGGSFSTASATIGDGTTSLALLSVTNTGAVLISDVVLKQNGRIMVSAGGMLTINDLFDSSSANSDIFVSNGVSGANGLTLGGAQHGFTYSGTIADGPTGPGGVNISGPGQVILNGTNTYTGPTNVTTGLIGGNGSIAGLVALSSGATISPGNLITSGPDAGMTGVGAFHIGSLTMNTGTTFQVRLDGPGSGQFDVLTVDKNVTLFSGCTLSLQVKFTPMTGQSFTILDLVGANAIVGQFDNAPDGGTITSNGQTFLISYEGGDGNDLTLTAVPVPEPTTSALLILNILPVLYFARKLGRKAG